jgi:hypothetical protein
MASLTVPPSPCRMQVHAHADPGHYHGSLAAAGQHGPGIPLTGYGTMDGPLNVTIIGNGCRAGT